MKRWRILTSFAFGGIASLAILVGIPALFLGGYETAFGVFYILGIGFGLPYVCYLDCHEAKQRGEL